MRRPNPCQAPYVDEAYVVVLCIQSALKIRAHYLSRLCAGVFVHGDGVLWYPCMKEKETHEMTLPLERFRMLVGDRYRREFLDPANCVIRSSPGTRLSVTKGKLSASQASIPPSSGRTLVIPLAR